MIPKEIAAAVSVVVVLVAIPAFIISYDNHLLATAAGEAKIFTLSGVAEAGLWTLEDVNGSNYWWKTFERAILYVEEGQEVVLRLQSTDVTHRFYAPALGIEPVEIEPGHTEYARFRAGAPGTYAYYCTSICGECHFYMLGWIVVSPKGEKPKAIDPKTLATLACTHDLGKPDAKDMIQWGQYLYESKGCTTCHGLNGRGDVVNLNYAKKTVPAHNTLAEKFFLEEKEDAEAFIALLLQRVDLEHLKKQPKIPKFTLVLTQYKAAKDLILKGKHCAKRDKTGPEPPLQMPSWRETLTDRDVDCILAYLLTLYPWEDEEDWEGDE